ncbi:unnamed protein product, partial [Heterotrigona itama]
MEKMKKVKKKERKDDCDQNLHVCVSASNRHEHLLTFRDVEETKKLTETCYEYIYQMFEIAKQVDMEDSAIIKYIIDGIQDEEINKTVLYGAKNVELKKKCTLYETMRKNRRLAVKRSRRLCGV